MTFMDKLKGQMDADRAKRETGGAVSSEGIFIRPDKEGKNSFRVLTFRDIPIFTDVYFYWLHQLTEDKRTLLSPKTFGEQHGGGNVSYDLYKRILEFYGGDKQSINKNSDEWKHYRSVMESPCTLIPGFLRDEDGNPVDRNADGSPVIKFLKLSNTAMESIISGLSDAEEDSGIDNPFCPKKGVDITIRWASKGQYSGEWKMSVQQKSKKAMDDLKAYQKTCDQLAEMFADGDDGLKKLFDYETPQDLVPLLKAYAKNSPVFDVESEGSASVGDARQPHTQSFDDADVPF